MKLDKHIAYRFLTDDSLMFEICEKMHPDFKEILESADAEEEFSIMRAAPVISLLTLLDRNDQKAYWLTETVLSKLDMLKVSKQKIMGEDHYDWTVFKNVPDQKATFIFPDNSLLRIRFDNKNIHFIHISYSPEDKDNGQMNWVCFFLNMETNEFSDNFSHIDVQSIEKFIYRLLCFFYLADNEYKLLTPGQKHGTRKTGKVINSLPINLTIVDNNWNVTSIRTEGFDVKGHFATRWVGKGRKTAKVVFIKPFKKKGYIRRAKNGKSIV